MPKRWFIYRPGIDEDSFVFFFFRNSHSWSIRDYKYGTAKQRSAHDFPDIRDADAVLEESMCLEPAETMNTNNIAWYQEKIRSLNEKFRYLMEEWLSG